MRIPSRADCNWNCRQRAQLRDFRFMRLHSASRLNPCAKLSVALRTIHRLHFFMESPLILVGIVVLAIFGLIFAIVLFNFFGIWLRARIANAPVGMGKMIGMRLRRVPVGLIVDNRITAVKAGIEVPSDPLEAHYLAGGDVTQVILALIAADKAGISLDFNRACAIDLATKGTGKTVLEAVRTSINPKVKIGRASCR